MNLETLSIEDLAQLRDDVNTKRAERVADRQRELSSEADRIGALLAQATKPKAFKSAPAKPKFQKGDQSWSGRGSQPAWVKQHLALGGTLDELAAWISAAGACIKWVSFGWLVMIKAHAFALVVGIIVWFSASLDVILNLNLILELHMTLHLQMALTALRRT
jgi:DNA-binding protein H-NS